MITQEPDVDRPVCVRLRVSALIFDRQGGVRDGALATRDETPDRRCFTPRRLPSTLFTEHRARIRDSQTRRAAALLRGREGRS